MKRLWLIFAQTVTICLAALLVITLFRPNLLPGRTPMETLREVVREEGNSIPIGSVREAARKATPSVVNIFTRKEVKARHPAASDNPLRRFFGDAKPRSETRQQLSLGSGVIVMSDGYILTNDHVIEGAQEIQVALWDGRTARAHVVGADTETDLAVLKVDLKNLPAITFGDSERIQVGDISLAIGNPFGLGETVTMGIVSALGRNRLGISTFENFIQTDAAINPGNSGGALVDVYGNLIGINSSIYSRSGGSMGIGFSIPVSIAKMTMEEIIRTGEITRGWIGVQVQDITPQMAESFHLDSPKGALIAGVLRGGPSERAGIKPGDVLMGINDKTINDSREMLNGVAQLKPTETASIKIIRNRQSLVFNVVVGKRPHAPLRNLEEEEDQ
jgi:serine protease DegQ